jgi:AGZA family xanthine/uracil permease-like MFS transporter
MINFDGGVPALSALNTGSILIALFGLILIAVLMLKKVKGSILIGIIASTILAVLTGVVDISTISLSSSSWGTSFSELGSVFGQAVGANGIGSLFSDPEKIPIVLTTIFAFSLTDTFDTIGTFIGTGRKSGIFSAADEKALEEGSGFSSKMDKALFADSIATSIGALFGTSNTTTYVESSAGIEEGGRTGLTSVTVAILFLVSIVLAPIVSIIPTAATAPALIIVGILMAGSFADINWKNLADAIPAFFAGIFMALTYSISTGIGFGFIFYCIVKIVTGKTKELNPVVWISALLFVLNFVFTAVL